MQHIGKYIVEQIKSNQISQEEAKIMLMELKQSQTERNEDIAITGVACKLPNCNNLEEFWSNIIHGRNCFVTKPPEKTLLDEMYKNPYYADLFDHEQWTEACDNVENYVGGFIKDFDKFDANFFGIPPREARYIDPQQRIFMEVAWSALEDAGYTEKTIRDSMTGIYVGRDGTNSNMYVFHTAYDAMSVSGNWSGILASRLNYVYNLKGPAMIIDTACSSGMVAIHEACNALRNNECNMAIAGGISIGAAGVEQEKKVENNEDKDAVNTVVSDDNMIRTFDKNCSGTVFSEGCTILILKKLDKAIEDRDHIYGIIKCTAVNSDGASNGLTAPNPVAQEEVIVNAWKQAHINPDDIDFVETHGTGTLLGDPIEVLGLSNAFERYTSRKQFCGVGSVKTNIGHTVAAAGVTNILKIILGMQHEVMPPTRNFAEPNEHINFVDSPVYVVDQPIEWKRGGKPRIACASAWGFSGTNAHTVVIEPPILPSTENAKTANIFTISAKTQTAIETYVKKYNDFFNGCESLNIQDICFTSNIGRGHYTYRIAIITNDFDDLKEKISDLYQNGIRTIDEKQVYYCVHQVVSSRKQDKAVGDITEKEANEFTKEAKTYLSILLDKNISDNEYKDKANELAQAYVHGAVVDWNVLYINEKVRRVSLPTYPFDRISYWGDKRDIGLKDIELSAPSERKHDFVDACIVSSVDETIYRIKFDLNVQWPLQEHVLIGNNVVSGTTYVEILKEAFERYYHTKQIVFDDIMFMNTIIVTQDNPTVEAHLVIKKEDEGESFVLASKHVDEDGNINWIEHMKGRVHNHSDKAYKCSTMKEIVESKNVESVGVIHLSGFGERWNCVEKNFRDTTSNDKVFYSFIKLQDKYKDDLKSYTYHPALLDNAINLIIMQLFTGTEFYLPFTYKSMSIYRNLPAHFYSRIERHDISSSKEVIAFGVTLVDEQGNLLANVEECTVKKISKFNDYFSCSFYGITWKEEKATISTQQVKGNVLVFSDPCGRTNALVNRIYDDTNIYIIDFADNYQKKGENHYSISGSMEDYELLLDDIGIDTISKVYHLSTIGVADQDYRIDDYEKEMLRGIYSMVYMNKVFSHRIKGTVDFVLVSDYVYRVLGTEKFLKSCNTSFFGLIKALIYECPSFTFKCIDIEQNTENELLINTMLGKGESSYRLAIRDNTVYSEALDKLDTTSAKKREIDILEDGIYMITGGTGGLGLLLAANLTEFAKCNICLIARRKIPDRNDWKEILTRNEDRKLCNLIHAIETMEERGCNVIIRYSDVSNYSSMKEVIDELKSQFGRINGVLHCAGVAGDGFNLSKPMEVFQQVITPKFQGSIVLAELLKQQSLDFFVMFSSMTSILGGPGQGDYAAANAFLDSFAYYLHNHGIENAQTVNWPGWSETGMAVDYNLSDAAALFKSLTNDYGINCFHKIIQTDLTNIIPGQINYDFVQKVGVENLPVRLSEHLEKEFEKFEKNKGKEDLGNKPAYINPEDIIITGKSENEYTETERIIACIYASVLNITQIDIYESFSSLGGDSIISTEVFKILNQQYDKMLSISDIFLYPTVESIAEYVDSLMNKNIKKEHKESFANVVDKFEQGEVDIDSIIDFLDEK